MDRAVSPVVAIVVLIGISVVGVAGVTAVSTDVVTIDERGESPTMTVSADADTQTIALDHHGGAPMDLRNCSMQVRVAGEPLAEQPPVPYFAADGFQGTPTGPFNSGGDPIFEPGERASLQIASTNTPHVESGDRVSVKVLRNGRVVATASVRAE